VAVMPWGARKPLKTFRVPGVKDMGETFMVPLCIAGETAVLRADSKVLVRLDLRTGALTSHDFEDAKGEVAIYPAPDGSVVFYFESDNPSDGKTSFGRLNRMTSAGRP